MKILLTLMTSALLAQRAGTGASLPTPGSASATVSGIVISSEVAGGSISGALVTLNGPESPLGLSAISDVEGRFSIEQVPAGRYTLVASKSGFLTSAYGAARVGQPGNTLTVSLGDNVRGITIAMARMAVISGTIRDRNGTAIQDALISAARLVPGSIAPSTPATTSSDDRGGYRILGLLPGEYLVSASFPSASMIQQTAANSASENDAILAMLERRQAGSSVVLPLPGSQQPFGLLPVFYPGVLDFAQAVPVNVASGDDRVGTDITLQLGRIVSLEGTVVSQGSVLPAVMLTVVKHGPILPPPMGVPARDVRPDRSGRFRVTGLSPGTYTVMAHTLGEARPISDGAESWGAVDIGVGDSDLTGIVVALRPAFKISGRIAFEGRAMAGNKEVSQMRVALVPTVGRAVLGSSRYGGATISPNSSTGVVRADRQFAVAAVAPGSYSMALAPLPPGTWLRSAMVGERDILDDPLEVGLGSAPVENAILIVSDRHTVLSGVVRDRTSMQPLASSVIVLPRDRSMWFAGSRRVRNVSVGDDGRFVVRDLPAGEYLVVASADQVPDSFQDTGFYERLATAATAITLGQGEQREQDLFLRRR